MASKKRNLESTVKILLLFQSFLDDNKEDRKTNLIKANETASSSFLPNELHFSVSLILNSAQYFFYERMKKVLNIRLFAYIVKRMKKTHGRNYAFEWKQEKQKKKFSSSTKKEKNSQEQILIEIFRQDFGFWFLFCLILFSSLFLWSWKDRCALNCFWFFILGEGPSL